MSDKTILTVLLGFEITILTGFSSIYIDYETDVHETACVVFGFLLLITAIIVAIAIYSREMSNTHTMIGVALEISDKNTDDLGIRPDSYFEKMLEKICLNVELFILLSLTFLVFSITMLLEPLLNPLNYMLVIAAACPMIGIYSIQKKMNEIKS